MPRIIRKTPLKDRLQAYLDFGDLFLWLSETLNDDAYDELLKEWSTAIGIFLNILFIFARGTSKSRGRNVGDDVFGDVNATGSSGWFSWIVSITCKCSSVTEVANIWCM